MFEMYKAKKWGIKTKIATGAQLLSLVTTFFGGKAILLLCVSGIVIRNRNSLFPWGKTIDDELEKKVVYLFFFFF